MSETINRDEILRELEKVEDELERLEATCTSLREKLRQTNEHGVGVTVSYDYDYGWLIETMNDGEWEIHNEHSRFSEAAHDGRALAKQLGCGVEIDPYKPKKAA